ncbi:MAG: hypothetical protein JXB85_05270 [Anaerolineales bacterium]|nr:hypothetical protein [Anaerolineales bacterium]
MTENTSPIYCANHPGVETVLRCNKCEKPICVRCAVRTPTGYRCKECVRSHRQVFDSNFNNAKWYDYPIALVTSGGLSLLASLLIFFISSYFWGLLVLFMAPAAGELISRSTQWALRRRRSRALFLLAPAGVVLGALPVILFTLLTGLWFNLIWLIVFLVIAVPVVYYRITGIRLR